MKEIYNSLPNVDCQGKCQAACGMIGLSSIENDEIKKFLGYEPKGDMINGSFEASCPLLKEGKCSIYEIRPLICRLYGVVDDELLKCPHGCEPERWLSREEGLDLLAKVQELSDGKWYSWHDNWGA